jgi:Mce-associated membrane protein
VIRHRLPNGGKGVDGPADTDSADETLEAAASEAVERAETDAAGDSPAEDSSNESAEESTPEGAKRHLNWSRVFAFGMLPALALLLALAAGYLKWVDNKWVDNSLRNADRVRIESVQAAKDSTVAMLSYKPDTVERQLHDARNLLAGDFKESYTGLINDVVIPGAKQKHISAVASIPAAASVSADPNKAVVLVFVNQTTVVGQGAPTDTASSVRVTLEKIGGRWLISKFDPV